MAPIHDQRARFAITLAAAGSAIGIAIAGTLSQTVGGVFLVGSWATFLYALHAFGRSGED